MTAYRNAPLTAAQRRALISILRAHKANPGRKRRKVRKARKARRTRAQRAAALRNLRKARAALRRRLRRKYGTTSRRAIRRTRAFNLRQRRTWRRLAKSGYKDYKPRSAAQRRASVVAAFQAGHDTGDYSAYTADNPFRKSKVRRYSGRRRSGTVIKVKGRYRIITKLRNGVRVTRPWAIRRRR